MSEHQHHTEHNDTLHHVHPDPAHPASATLSGHEMLAHPAPPVKAELKGVTEGRMVHFIMDEGKQPGAHRPAVITNVHDKVTGCVNLHVMTDGKNDHDKPPVHGTLQKTSVLHHAASENKHGTWHFIEPV